MSSPDYSDELRRKLSATTPRAGEPEARFRRSAAAARFAAAVRKDRREMVKRLHRDGKSDEQIALALGITADDVREYRTSTSKAVAYGG